MSFHAIAFTESTTAAWPTTSVGDDVYALFTADDDPTATVTVSSTGWTIVGTSQGCTFDGQIAALFHYTGNSGQGAPASPPTTVVWTTSGGAGDPAAAVFSLSGRTIGGRSFTTVTTNNTGQSTPFNASVNTGTAVAGDDIVLIMALDPGGNLTHAPSMTLAGYIAEGGVGGGFSGIVCVSLDNSSAGAIGTLAPTVTDVTPNTMGWINWALACNAASTGTPFDAIAFGAEC